MLGKIIFVISWCVLTRVPIPCPDAPKKNEFGIMEGHHCAVYHFSRETKCDSLIFDNRKDAEACYLRAKQREVNGIFEDGLINVKIDSIQ